MDKVFFQVASIFLKKILSQYIKLICVLNVHVIITNIFKNIRENHILY